MEDPGLRSSVIRSSAPLIVGMLLLTAAAFFIRLQGLGGPDGDLRNDESRLALAAQGVLATGLPKVPSGRIYTRGVISTYLMALSLWLFGPHDFAARLPSTVVGTLLVPVAYLFGRAAAGTAGGLCAAAFAALQPDLIKWSDNAWMPSLFVLVFVAAVYFLYQGFGHDRSTMQVAGALGFVIALFVHEFAVLLPMAVFTTVAIRAARRDVGWFAGRRSVVALLIFGFGLVLFVVLGLLLRMGTVAGSTGEFQAYIRPSLTLASLSFYYHQLVRGYPLLLAAAALGIPLLVRSYGTGILFLYVTMGVGIITLGFLLSKHMERYGLMYVPLLSVIAAWSIAEGARLVATWWKVTPVTAARIPPIALVLVFGLSLQGDLRAAMRPERPPAQGWLSEFRALGPALEDLLLSDVVTIVAFYQGRVDYWARVRNYERYSYVAGDEIRELYTGAVMVSSESDFQKVVIANPGRRLWYLGDLRRFSDPYNAVAPDLRARLVRSAQVSRITRDGWVILGIDLGGAQSGQQ